MPTIDDDARSVLRRHWPMAGPLGARAGGIVRDVWRAGGFWLTACEVEDVPALSREQRLIAAIGERIDRGRLTVPDVVTARDGEIVVEDAGFGWRLLSHVDGVAPPADRATTFVALAQVLADVHRTLESLSPDLAVMSPGLSVQAERHLGRHGDPVWRPFGAEDEAALLGAADTWLAPRLQLLTETAHQIVHGDWIPRNIAINDGRVSVFDFEHAVYDTPAIDLGQMLSTIVMWSGLPDADDVLRRTLAAYAGRAETARFDDETIRAAAVAYWVVNYWRFQDRRRRGDRNHVEGFRRSAAVQPQRLRDILRFVGAV